ncbi:hypothetical protein [Leptolyngbya subtilissima]|uniref:hypothetical protein n=1 Tax=Leptolyngbya subtilissima TaxID=1346803 RepID=UPI003D65F4FC
MFQFSLAVEAQCDEDGDGGYQFAYEWVQSSWAVEAQCDEHVKAACVKFMEFQSSWAVEAQCDGTQSQALVRRPYGSFDREPTFLQPI